MYSAPRLKNYKEATKFSQRYPEIAEFLDGPRPDKDVQSLLEGFALLTAPLKKRLNDELPELSEAILRNVSPHDLKPFPSCAIARFTPSHVLSQGNVIPAGFQCSDPEAAHCSFQTCREVQIYPLAIERAESFNTARGGQMSVRLKVLNGVAFSFGSIERLSFYLGGTPEEAFFINEYNASGKQRTHQKCTGLLAV